ncbi:conserved Plasmodium protein, unknown function [Plasmodium malariae]|uniref:RNA-editing substrate-binding complex 6 protein domain-containing protein n=1 Tax=Plasmodium malariae TaxID=5858 RepID=A0A1A8W333_PLAMA|nr:conserved Plasmodium protein, unknown function [Plasmodium malariae]
MIRHSKILRILKNEKSYFCSMAKKKFGELHQPRTRCEKKNHLEIIDQVYFDMMDAMKEKSILEKEEYRNMDRNISEIILNHNISEKNQVIKNIMRYCIELNKKRGKKEEAEEEAADEEEDNKYRKKKRKNVEELNNRYDPQGDILNLIKSNVKEYSSQFNSCEIGIILKCFLKIKMNDLHIIHILLHHFFKRNMKFSQYGTLYVLNSFSKLSLLPQNETNFKLLCSDILQKLNNFEFKNICLICNYASALYRTNKVYIKNFIEKICKFLINDYSISSNDDVWSTDSIHYIANACARVNYLNKELFLFLKHKIEKKIAFFSLDQLVSLTNAYSKFKNAEEANFLSLYILIADEIIKKSYLLKSRHMSVLANSFNNACVLHEKLFYIITECSLTLISTFEPKQIVMIIHAYVNIGLLNNVLLDSIWNTALVYIDEYHIQELSMLLQAYTKSSQHRQNFFNKLCQRIYIFITSTYPFVGTNEKNLEYTYEKYIKSMNILKHKYKILSTSVTLDDCSLLLYVIYNHQNYCIYVNDTILKCQEKKQHYRICLNYNNNKEEEKKYLAASNDIAKNEEHCTDKREHSIIDHISYQNGYDTDEISLKMHSSENISNSLNNIGTNSNNEIFTAQGDEKKDDARSEIRHVMSSGKVNRVPYSNKSENGNTGNSDSTGSNICGNTDPIESQMNYMQHVEYYSNDIDKAGEYLIKYLSKDINSTLLCSIIYSLIKGNCLLQYDLLICLSKLTIIFLKQFKSSELANICTALSEAYIFASDENNRQNELISKNQKKENRNISNLKQVKSIGVSNSNKSETYDEKLYFSSKQYLITCKLFFDMVESYLKEKEHSFTDVYSTYKFITSFGALRMIKYSSVALHLFKLSILEIKNLSYLPLQKIVISHKDIHILTHKNYAPIRGKCFYADECLQRGCVRIYKEVTKDEKKQINANRANNNK